MYDDIRGYCKTSNMYQRNKPAELSTTLPTPTTPFESIAINFMEPFNTSNGFKNIIVIQDRFSAATIIKPLMEKKHSAKDVTDVMFSRYYAHYGFPASILSDRDPPFLSAF